MVLDINVNVNNSKGKSKAGKNPKKGQKSGKQNASKQENKPRVKHYMLQNFFEEIVFKIDGFSDEILPNPELSGTSGETLEMI
jgi:hypothetical protein